MELLTRDRGDALQRALDAPAPDPRHARDVALVGRLREAGDAAASSPTPEFRTALRTRLMAVAAVQGIGSPTTAPAPAAVSWRARAAAVTAGALATAVAATGVAVASSSALPGDPFYGVKRLTETVQLQVADGAAAEGERHLQFAATRLREVRALVLGRDAPADAVAAEVAPREVADRVHEALADMDRDTRTGLQLLTADVRSTRAATPLDDLSRFALSQGEGLRAVLPALSGPSLLRAEQSLVLLDGVRAEAEELRLLLDCTAVCDPSQAAPGAVPAPGAAGSPCSCTPPAVPAPQTAPPPPAPQGEQPAPGTPAPGSGPAAPPSAPGAPPGPAPQQPAPEPSDPPLLPGLPLPELPLPDLPLPSLPPIEPLGPDGPSIRLPQPDDLLDGLLGLGPVLGLLGLRPR